MVESGVSVLPDDTVHLGNRTSELFLQRVVVELLKDVEFAQVVPLRPQAWAPEH